MYGNTRFTEIRTKRTNRQNGFGKTSNCLNLARKHVRKPSGSKRVTYKGPQKIFPKTKQSPQNSSCQKDHMKKVAHSVHSGVNCIVPATITMAIPNKNFELYIITIICWTSLYLAKYLKSVEGNKINFCFKYLILPPGRLQH